MKGLGVRISVAIDDDVLSIARAIAEKQNRSLGTVISELARRGLMPLPCKNATMRNSIPVLPMHPNYIPITLDLVNRLRDEGAL